MYIMYYQGRCTAIQTTGFHRLHLDEYWLSQGKATI